MRICKYDRNSIITALKRVYTITIGNNRLSYEYGFVLSHIYNVKREEPISRIPSD